LKKTIFLWSLVFLPTIIVAAKAYAPVLNDNWARCGMLILVCVAICVWTLLRSSGKYLRSSLRSFLGNFGRLDSIIRT
jgi:hypothetical protein